MCFLFSHYQFSFYFRPTEPLPKWGDEYPTLNEVYNSQTNQRASVIPFNAAHTAGSRNLTKSSQVQEQKRNISLPSLFPDEGTLRNSTTLTGMYVLITIFPCPEFFIDPHACQPLYEGVHYYSHFNFHFFTCCVLWFPFAL